MIVVTGGAGFIGKHLVNALLNKDEKVLIVDNLSHGEHDGRSPVPILVEDLTKIDPLTLASNIFYVGITKLGMKDIRDIKRIYHLAADYVRVQSGKDEIQKVIGLNMASTVTALELARLADAELIFASSCTVKGDGRYRSPYGMSKFLGEELCEMYKSRFGLKYKSARIFNAYGPGQYETGPQATLIGVYQRAMRLGEKLKVYGNGRQIRDYIHVTDVANNLVAMADAQLIISYEISSGRSYSVNQVADMFGGEIESLPALDCEIKISDSWMSFGKTTITLPDYVRKFKESLRRKSNDSNKSGT